MSADEGQYGLDGVTAIDARLGLCVRTMRTKAEARSYILIPIWIRRRSMTGMGGASLNAVPSQCEIYLDRRLRLGEGVAQVKEELDGLPAGFMVIYTPVPGIKKQIPFIICDD